MRAAASAGASATSQQSAAIAGAAPTMEELNATAASIAENARAPRSASADELAAQKETWRRLLALPAEDAAAIILRGIERREARVLVGQDAVRAAWVQRLFPVGYWKHVARDIARRAGAR